MNGLGEGKFKLVMRSQEVIGTLNYADSSETRHGEICQATQVSSNHFLTSSRVAAR